MRIVKDEPQQLLVIEAQAVNAPRAVLGCLGVVLFGFFVGAPAFQIAASILRGARPGPAELAASLLVLVPGLAMAILVFWGLRRAGRYVQRLSVDRYGGALTIVEHSPLGGARTRSVPLEGLERILAGTAQVKPSLGDTQPGVGGMSRLPRLGLRLRLEWREGGRARQQVLSFPVEEVDSREEVVDLAYRLARAAGLLYCRVVRSDPREVELEITREHGAGAEPVPLLTGAAGYGRDVVAPQAARAAGEERVPPFDPAAFRGDMKAAVWEPRQRVVFRRGLGAAIGCLPFTLLVLTGPAFYASAPLPPAERLPVSILIGLFGLFFGLLAAGAVATSLPRSVVLDWSDGSLERRGLFTRRRLLLSSVRELEMRGIRQRHTSKNSSYHTYRCAIVLRVHPEPAAGAATELVVVETERFREDPDTPYRMALPLATELSAALAVPRRLTDFA